LLGGAADATGISAVYTGITGRDLATQHHLSLTPAQQRQMLTEGSIQAVGSALMLYGGVRSFLRGRVPVAPQTAQGPPVRVFTTTDAPVDLGRAGTGATGPGGVPTPRGVGGTFVTTTDITNPRALELHLQRNVPPGSMPRYVTEVEVPPQGVRIDPTEPRIILQNGWVAPNTPGARVVRVWEIRWVQDPRGFDVPTLVEVPLTGR
jgi:hypothetical protein